MNKARADWLAAGITVTVDEACQSQCELTDVTTNIETFASSFNPYDLIIGIGFSALDGIDASARAHTNRNFMIIDDTIDLPNVWSITFKEHEGSFLAGAMAAMVSKSNDIAFLGGLDIPLINRFLAGYEHGARTINPNIVVRAVYSPDPNNPWGDLEGGKTIAKEFISKGSDVIFAAASGTGLGSINGVVEHNEDNPGDKVWAIGVEGDQDSYSEGDILTSMIKSIDIAVEDQINATVMGTWAPSMENRGIAENGVRLSVMSHTATEANAPYNATMTRLEKIDELTYHIESGNINVREFVGDDISGQNILFGSEDPSNIPEINSPQDINYSEGESGSKIEWVGQDDNPTTFEIERNGDMIQSGTWESDIPILIDVSSLNEGEYFYTITIWDLDGNSNADTVKVTVEIATSSVALSYPEIFAMIGILPIVLAKKKSNRSS